MSLIYGLDFKFDSTEGGCLLCPDKRLFRMAPTSDGTVFPWMYVCYNDFLRILEQIAKERLLNQNGLFIV